ncbi:unnamed protein product [Brassica rapa]|uniref:Uncharacterized protein n=1 Tax=Brassica campestris TaxID=3711 RepID=A0A8D9M2C3_BRACM|nr:unnamed protein product [Brassica rapa]
MPPLSNAAVITTNAILALIGLATLCHQYRSVNASSKLSYRDSDSSSSLP